MNYYQHHIGDYVRATAHLTWMEDCAYRRMIEWYYAEERPLPGDKHQVYRLIRAASRSEREAVDAVLGEFFHLSDAGYQHRRCDAELSRAQEKSSKARNSAAQRWHSEGNANADANASTNAMRTHSEGNALHKPIANSQEPIPKNPPTPRSRDVAVADPPGFDAFWQAYPNTGRKVGKGKCLQHWRTKKLEPQADQIVAHVVAIRETEQWRTGYEPAPMTYLSQERWQDPVPRAGPRNEARAYLEATLNGGGDGPRSQAVAGDDAGALRRGVPPQMAGLLPPRNG